LNSIRSKKAKAEAFVNKTRLARTRRAEERDDGDTRYGRLLDVSFSESVLAFANEASAPFQKIEQFVKGILAILKLEERVDESLVFERTRSQSQCSQELYNNPTQHKKNGNK
jgi:hypothetical protein